MPVADITVATSVAPRDAEAQRAAIETWQHHGMRVISVNPHDEVDELRGILPEVELVDIGVLDREHTNRNLVYFDQLIAVLKASGSPACAIINADIHLRAPEGFSRALAAAAEGGFVLAHRVDVDDLAQSGGTAYQQGYDLLCCDRSLLDAYPASPFRIGAPWWDLWAAAVPVLRGHRIKLLTDPVGFHQRHEASWKSEEEWQTYALLFVSQFLELARERHALWPSGPAEFENDAWGAISRIVTGEALTRIDALSAKVGVQPGEPRAALTATSTMFLLSLSAAVPHIVSAAAEEISL